MKEKKIPMLLRIPESEIENLKKAAKLDNRSVNQWCVLRITKLAKAEINKHSIL